MSQQSLAEAAVEVMKRVEAENQAISAQEIILDTSNEVSFPGYPYTFRALTERILVSIDVFKTGYECKTCKGKKQIETKQGRESVLVDCPVCHGLGATLILPETSKNLPTTGVIVSMGLKAMEELAKEKIHIGDRILFGAHAGTMIPTKVGLMFKYMDWYCAALKIEGADDMSAFDFILQAE